MSLELASPKELREEETVDLHEYLSTELWPDREYFFLRTNVHSSLCTWQDRELGEWVSFFRETPGPPGLGPPPPYKIIGGATPPP